MTPNPFPRLAIPSKDLTLMYDPDGMVSDLLEYLSNVFDEGSKAGVLIVGNYGQGKTHVLRYLSIKLRERYKDSLVLDIPAPGANFRDLYRSIVTKIMESIDLASLNCGRSQACTAISLLETEGGEALNWLLAEPTSTTFRRRHNLRNNRADQDTLKTLTEIINALVASGYGPITLLLDEFETLLSYASYARLRYLNAFRHLIDELPSPSAVVVSSTPAEWVDIINTHPALARRLSSYVVYLRNLRLEEIPRFLNLYLSEVGLSAEDVFCDDVIDRIYDVTEGNPGEILKYAAILYDIYRREGSRLSADSDRVKAVLANYA